MKNEMRESICGRRLAAMLILLGAIVAGGCSDSDDTPTSPANSIRTIYPTKDNTLFEDAEGDVSSGSGPVLFVGNTGDSLTRRALVAFDVAAHVPAGSQIVRVELRLNVSKASDSLPRIVTIYRALADWGEGPSASTSGSGAPADTNDATWLNTFYPDSLWASPGGDFDPVPTDSLTLIGLGSYAVSGSALAADVQDWLDNPAADFGWLLRGDESQRKTARKLDSREHPTQANRPTLTVEFN